MTKTNLHTLLENGENSGVEFKRDAITNVQLARELVAFANLRGGCVLLGVEDDGTPCGLTRQDIEEWVMTACRDKIRPELIPYFEIVRDVTPGKDVAIVRIEQGWDVHHLWHNNHRSYYVRVGSQSREASPEELQRLFQQRGNIRAELRPVSGATLADLDLERLTEYFEAVRGQTAPPKNDARAWETLLLNTELLTSQEDVVTPTLAGILLFGTATQRFLPHCGMDAAAYYHNEKDYAARERGTIKGPMAPLLSKPTDTGLVERAVAFIQRNAQPITVLDNGARRTEKPAYPVEALRETLVNALVHRDYLLSATNIELSVYADRLEVVSPGRLPNGITTERMITGCRAARNQLLKDIMRDYGYLEHMGMGVPRKIIKGMREHNNTLPEFIAENDQLTVRLWREPPSP